MYYHKVHIISFGKKQETVFMLEYECKFSLIWPLFVTALPLVFLWLVSLEASKHQVEDTKSDSNVDSNKLIGKKCLFRLIS